MLRKVPLIVILGSTGTGKTKLSIELAQKFGGEVISADSMQVYADLDIVTAKATKAEQQAVPHHLLDVVKPSETFTVKHFQNLASPIIPPRAPRIEVARLPIGILQSRPNEEHQLSMQSKGAMRVCDSRSINMQIDDLLSASKYPIVVGGTNYYIESLLWDILVGPPAPLNPSASPETATATPRTTGPDSSDSPEVRMMQPAGAHSADHGEESSTPSEDSSDLELETMSSQELHDRLKQVDRISAGRIHPNNKRKILRALEVYQFTGKPMSEHINEQRTKPGGNRLGGPLRYPYTILFWLRCDQDILNQRLNERVDSMLEKGLLLEVRHFYEVYMKSKAGMHQYTQGILQSIGFKEFVPYLEKFDKHQDKIIDDYLRSLCYKLPGEPSASEPAGVDMLRKCLDELKLVTRRYSKRQIKWIKNRFLGSHDRQVPPLYALDTSDVGQWQSMVYSPAIDVIESYIDERVPKCRPMERVQHPGYGLNEEVLNFCELCKRHFVGEFQWKTHLASNKHKRAKDGLRKRLKRSGSGIVGDAVVVEGETDATDSTCSNSHPKYVKE